MSALLTGRTKTWNRSAFKLISRRKSSAPTAADLGGDQEVELREPHEVPGPGWWWLLKLSKPMDETYQELYDTVGRKEGSAQIRDAKGNLNLVVFNQDDVRHVYQNEGKDVRGTSSIWPSIKYWKERSGDTDENHSLNLLLQGPRWRNSRDLLGKGIYTDAVATYEPAVQVAAREAVDYVTDYEHSLDVWAELAAFDLFTSLALGSNPRTTDPNCKNPLKEVVELDSTSLGIAVLLEFLPWFARPRNGYEKMKASFDRIADLTRPEVERLFNQKDVPVCWFRDLRDEQGLSTDRLTDVMAFMLTASIGTTKGVLEWMLTSLAYYPESQQRLRDEISKNLKNGPYTKSVKMPYLEALFREQHRRYPMAHISGLRTLNHDIVLPNSRVHVPAGTTMQLAPLFEAQDTNIISDADQFIPERYLRENKIKRKGCPFSSKLDAAVIRDPFSNGARVCLGKRAAELEVRTLICELVRRYEIVLDPATQPFPGYQHKSVMVPNPMPKVKLVPVQHA